MSACFTDANKLHPSILEMAEKVQFLLENMFYSMLSMLKFEGKEFQGLGRKQVELCQQLCYN